MSNVHWRFTAASFSPGQVSMMTSAFENAWRMLAGNCDADRIPGARERLATSIIELASGWPHDVESLTRAAVAVVQKNDGAYPSAARFHQWHSTRS